MEEIRRFGPAELEKARLDLTRALEDNPKDDLTQVLAATHLRLGSPLEAEALLVELLARLGDGTQRQRDVWREATFLLGVAYQKTGRVRSDGLTSSAAGWCAAHAPRSLLKQAEQAMDAFEDVLSDDNNHWRCRFHMALLVSEEPIAACGPLPAAPCPPRRAPIDAPRRCDVRDRRLRWPSMTTPRRCSRRSSRSPQGTRSRSGCWIS